MVVTVLQVRAEGGQHLDTEGSDIFGALLLEVGEANTLVGPCLSPYTWQSLTISLVLKSYPSVYIAIKAKDHCKIKYYMFGHTTAIYTIITTSLGKALISRWPLLNLTFKIKGEQTQVKKKKRHHNMCPTSLNTALWLILPSWNLWSTAVHAWVENWEGFSQQTTPTLINKFLLIPLVTNVSKKKKKKYLSPVL